MSDSYTPISMIRGNSTVIDSTPIVDGQILFDETRKCLFMDNGSTREKYSGLGADSNIANVEDTTTASQPYTTGEFVVVEGQLYKVTASIATGDTFSVGTNIETDTVGSELTKINTYLSKQTVSVTADGTKTYSQILNELFALIDTSTINSNSVLEIGAVGVTSIYRPISIRNDLVSFAKADVGSDYGVRSESIIMKQNNSVYLSAVVSTVKDNSATIAPSGYIFKLTHG